LAAAGLGVLLRWLSPGMWVFALVSGFLPVFLGLLAFCGLVLLAALAYGWHRSDGLDR
jgi:hypothetical protein